MKLEKMKPGMVVYSVSRQKIGNTTLSTVAVHPVQIVDVDVARGIVNARWNFNASRCYYRREAEKWREKEPVLVKSGWAMRLATRAELRTMKESAP